jgi:YD repeat-containing protein
VRTLTHDAAGNITADNTVPGGGKTYTYNKRNRLSVATVGALTYTYTYNAMEQLASRVQSSPAATFLLAVLRTDTLHPRPVAAEQRKQK